MDDYDDNGEKLTSIEWHNLASQMPVCNEIPSSQRGRFIRGICKIRGSKKWTSEGIIISHDWINIVAAHLSLLSLGHPGEPFPALHTIRFCKTFADARLYAGERDKGVMSVASQDLEKGALGNKTRANAIITEAIFFASAFSTGALVPLPPGSTNPREWESCIKREKSRCSDLDTGAQNALITRLGVSPDIAFLAVASQIFFEEPSILYRRYRRLFTLLKHLYAVDTASITWEAPGVEYGVYEEFVTSDTEILM